MSAATAAAPSAGGQARPWNPDFRHTDRESLRAAVSRLCRWLGPHVKKGMFRPMWVCIYPAYINSKKTLKEGRRVPKSKAVENPVCAEIRDVCIAAGFTLGVENKVYPREEEPRDVKFRGRVRVQLRNEDGTPVQPQFPNRMSLLLHLGQTIPKLKSRPQSSSQSQQQQQQQQQSSSKSQKKKGRK